MSFPDNTAGRKNLELRDYIDILYNRKWIVVGTLAVILSVTLVVTFAQAATYESSVKLLAQVNSASDAILGDMLPQGSSDLDRFIQNQSEIIETDTLARAVERQLEYRYEQATREDGKASFTPASLPGAEQLREMVSVRVGAKTGIFDIVVKGGDRRLTRDVAEAYAEEYLSNRQLAAIRQISEARKEVWNRLQEVEEQLQNLARDSKQYKVGEVPTDVVASIQQSAALWATLYEKYISLRVSESLEQRGLEIVEAAQTGEKVGPKPARNGVLAAFLGLILGVGLAFFVDYMDDTLHTREEFERYYGASIVGEIPFIPSEDLSGTNIVYLGNHGHPAVEGYRTLRTNLRFLNLKQDNSAVLVTSAMPEEGKSTVTVNLGAALAETGKRVLLVEGDLRKPALGKFFEHEGPDGITGVLAGTCGLEDAILESGHPDLYVLPAGVRPPNPGELVASDAMRALLDRVRESFDFVLVDAPPALAASDAIAMAPMVDGVLVVGRYETADREGAKRTTELLRKVEANILGVVITNLEVGKRYSYYHYYYYDASAGDRKRGGHGLKRRNGRKRSGASPPGA